MNYIPNFFTKPELLTSFLFAHTDVMVNCFTHNESTQEIMLIFPTGSYVRFFSDGCTMIYNSETNEFVSHPQSQPLMLY
jgi:hypothetical protein